MVIAIAAASHRLTFSQSPVLRSRATPSWLHDIIQVTKPAPRLYAWSLDNLPNARTASRTAVTKSKRKHSRRIYVLGLGNLGRLFASSLARLPDPPPVTLVVHRRSLLEHWASSPGIEITHSAVVNRTENFDIEWWTEDKPSFGPSREVGNGNVISDLIVATKAPDAIPTVDRLRGYLNETSTVLFIQNGVSRLWPPHGAAYNEHRYGNGHQPNWILGVTMHGVYSLGTFKSVFASPADVIIGPVSLNNETSLQTEHLVSQLLAAPSLNGRTANRSEVWAMQLDKLVINSIINPLTAIMRCQNGVLFTNPHENVVKVMNLLLEQTSRVLQALILDSSALEILADKENPNPEEEDRTRQALLAQFSVPHLRERLYQVGDKVKDNYSSMYQDTVAGKQTEIREFNGWLVETAIYLDAGLDVSAHKAIIDLVESGIILGQSELGRHFPLQAHS